MDRERVLAFRAARLGLAELEPRSLAQAAACPASEFQRGSALLAVAARTTEVTRESYDRAIDGGELAVAHSLRGALHVLDAADVALFGSALIADGPAELLDQLGEQVKRQLAEHSIHPRDALEEVARASEDALKQQGALDKNELHEELRARVRPELLPWCPGCASHHVSPMLWRYALVEVGARRDSASRYVLREPAPPRPAAEALRRFLGFYGPATALEFDAWARVSASYARRLWQEIRGELTEVKLDGGAAWLLAADLKDLESPPAARGLRLLPPGDPYLQKPNRAMLVPDGELRKRAFRPAGSPGVVFQDGAVAGLWRARARGKRLEIEVDRLGTIDRGALETEAERIARLRGAPALAVNLSR